VCKKGETRSGKQKDTY